MRKAAGHSAKSSRLSTQRGASELLAGREHHAESSVAYITGLLPYSLARAQPRAFVLKKLEP